MHIHRLSDGACTLQLFASDLAIFALALRAASNSEAVVDVTPTMATLLESLAATFESTAILSLQQIGFLSLKPGQVLTEEWVHALLTHIVQSKGELPDGFVGKREME
jgi:hypothetical protein